MVHRENPGGLIVISQPAHSWVAGQLASQWGNAEFGSFAPFAEVCLAAEQHDMGFWEWERKPTLDAATGRPHPFTSMPTRPHLELWSASVAELQAYSRYAALLASLHVTHLCQNNKVTHNPRDAQALQDFLDQQHAIQSALRSDLRQDPAYADGLTAAGLERNCQLLAVWDWLSLISCMGRAGEQVIERVPTAQGLAALKIQLSPNDRVRMTVSPWPFQTGQVNLVCDGRQLPQTFTDQNEMRTKLREAPVVTVRMTLRSA